MKKLTAPMIIILLIFIFCVRPIYASSGYKYSIIHEVSGIRNDAGKCYFVLVYPPDLRNDSFKEEIKQAIREIVRQKGGKITLYFFDERKLLNAYHQSLKKGVPKSLSKKEVRHHIATFSGQYQVGSFYNYIYFFPGLTLNNFDPMIAYYVEWLVFDPAKDSDGINICN